MGKSSKTGNPPHQWPMRLKDKDGRNVVLTEAGWKHIVAEHPEMEGWLEWVKIALANPHLIFRSTQDNMCVMYYHFLPKAKLYVMVVTDWSDDPARILTAFPARVPKKGERIYVRKPDPLV